MAPRERPSAAARDRARAWLAKLLSKGERAAGGGGAAAPRLRRRRRGAEMARPAGDYARGPLVLFGTARTSTP